jgi:hypothetical protein
MCVLALWHSPSSNNQSLTSFSRKSTGCFFLTSRLILLICNKKFRYVYFQYFRNLKKRFDSRLVSIGAPFRNCCRANTQLFSKPNICFLMFKKNNLDPVEFFLGSCHYFLFKYQSTKNCLNIDYLENISNFKLL